VTGRDQAISPMAPTRVEGIYPPIEVYHSGPGPVLINVSTADDGRSDVYLPYLPHGASWRVTIDTEPADPSENPGLTNTLREHVATLEGHVATLEGHVATLEGQVSVLEGHVATLEGQVSVLPVGRADVEGRSRGRRGIGSAGRYRGDHPGAHGCHPA
jgi:hypothetical protein